MVFKPCCMMQHFDGAIQQREPQNGIKTAIRKSRENAVYAGYGWILIRISHGGSSVREKNCYIMQRYKLHNVTIIRQIPAFLIYGKEKHGLFPESEPPAFYCVLSVSEPIEYTLLRFPKEFSWNPFPSGKKVFQNP